MAYPRHPQRTKAERMLAAGVAPNEVAVRCKVHVRTARKWRAHIDDNQGANQGALTSSLHVALEEVARLGLAKLEDIPNGSIERGVIARDLLDLGLVKGSLRSGLRITEAGRAQLAGEVLEGETTEERQAKTAERVARHRARRREVRVPAGCWSDPLPEGTWVIDRVEEADGECFVVLIPV